MRISDWSSDVCSSDLETADARGVGIDDPIHRRRHNRLCLPSPCLLHHNRPMRENSSDDATMIDGHGRRISYLRLSVTDRCDLRCRYCMAEDMTFLTKSAVLSIEEMAALAESFVARGLRRIGLTGGDPLVRRGKIGRAHV